MRGGSGGHSRARCHPPPALTVLLAQDGALLPQEGSPARARPRVGSRDSGVPAGNLPQMLVIDLGGKTGCSAGGREQDAPQLPPPPSPRGSPQFPPPQFPVSALLFPSPFPTTQLRTRGQRVQFRSAV